MGRLWFVHASFSENAHRILTRKYGQTTTEEAAVDIAAFVATFFERFDKFKGRGFHLSGESYGVRLISY